MTELGYRVSDKIRPLIYRSERWLEVRRRIVSCMLGLSIVCCLAIYPAHAYASDSASTDVAAINDSQQESSLGGDSTSGDGEVLAAFVGSHGAGELTDDVQSTVENVQSNESSTEAGESDTEPMGDQASGGALANSFRFQDGIPIDSGVSALARTAGNSWTYSNGVYTATDGTRVTGAKGFGIDVSSWQGSIDWNAVKNSGLVDYVIIRCGWGSDYASQDDSRFLQYVRGCQEAGIPFGIYLYSYAFNTQMAQSEAQHVLRLLKSANLDPSQIAYPIYLDLENEAGTGRPCGQDGGQKVYISNEMLAQIASTFCNAISQAGYRPGVYANLKWWNSYLTSPVFEQWSKWVAQYNTSCSYQGAYDMWQCMSDGRIPGISGNVDINFDFTGLKSSGSAGVPMYRMYNPNTSEHFYTANTYERLMLIDAGWTYEGIGWYAPLSSGTPVYRLYNENVSDHHYTTSAAERDALVRVGWKSEGIGWYSDDAHGAPLYRLYNPYTISGMHHYTLSAGERDVLVTLGWRYEGTCWYSVS